MSNFPDFEDYCHHHQNPPSYHPRVQSSGICELMESVHLWKWFKTKYKITLFDRFKIWIEMVWNVFNEYLIVPSPSMRNVLIRWRKLFTPIVSTGPAWPRASPELKINIIVRDPFMPITWVLAPRRFLFFMFLFLLFLSSIPRVCSQSSLCSVSLASEILLDLPIFKQFWTLGLYSLK